MKLFFMLMLLCGNGLSWTFAESAVDDYISQVRRVIVQSRARLPEYTTSAEEAAKKFLSGGRIFAAGRQEDFISEACGRAGGLMCIQPLGNNNPGRQDIILYAASGKLNADDIKHITQWEKNGASVVRFCSDAGLYKGKFPVDTVANVINLWMWTGEFAAACTRLGKMPVFYQSIGLPGGKARAEKYQGQRVHADLKIQPIAAGVLGLAYLDKIDVCLAGLQKQQDKFKQAAMWWRNATNDSVTVFIIGHMFPKNFQDSRLSPSVPFTAAPHMDDKKLIDEKNPPKFVLYIGYQYAPHELIEQARRLKVNLTYADVQADKPAAPSENVVYINPGWPLDDSCVSVPRYDVPILPASGVIQAAIYWQILSDK